MDGGEIRQNRKLLGLTQKQLAQELGVSGNTIINWERGDNIPKSKYPILYNLFKDFLKSNNVTYKKESDSDFKKLASDESMEIYLNSKNDNSDFVLESNVKNYDDYSGVNSSNIVNDKPSEYKVNSKNEAEYLLQKTYKERILFLEEQVEFYKEKYALFNRIADLESKVEKVLKVESRVGHLEEFKDATKLLLEMTMEVKRTKASIAKENASKEKVSTTV